MQVVDSHICDEEHDSNQRADCTGDTQAHATLQLKKIQREGQHEKGKQLQLRCPETQQVLHNVNSWNPRCEASKEMSCAKQVWW